MSDLENSHSSQKLDTLLEKIKQEHDDKEFSAFFITSIFSIFLLFAIIYIVGVIFMKHDMQDFISMFIIFILGSIPLWALINFIVFQIQKILNPVTQRLNKQLTELRTIKDRFVEGIISESELIHILGGFPSSLTSSISISHLSKTDKS
jgi:hypothetical protein